MNSNSNLPPGVRESDLPGNRPSDEQWDRYCDKYDTAKARKDVVGALLDLFVWKGLGEDTQDYSEAKKAAKTLVDGLSSIPFLALQRGVYIGKTPMPDDPR